MNINFKDAVKRGSALLGVAGLLAGVGASAIPAFMPAVASADALNPLTQRSLTLSSSAPGYENTDGSGNATYAYPGSGANGQQTSNYYSFNVSSTHAINAMTFQYCTAPAGDCVDPGDDTVHGTDTPTSSDLNIVTGTGGGAPQEIAASGAGDWAAIKARTETTPPSDPHAGMPKEDNSEGNFVVLTGAPGSQTVSTGWTMSVSNAEESGGVPGTVTNASNHNMITLVNNDTTHDNPANGVSLSSDEHIQVIFFATNTNYITNPGNGAFFVKINDYEIPVNDTATPGTYVPTDVTTDANPITGGVGGSSGTGYVIDGGVTVANVMNQSIEIQTKVLETMQFSVGTVDPDTLTTTEISNDGSGLSGHGSCDNILPAMTPSAPQDVLYLGNPTEENSLSTSETYGAHSYWRLSSNSSAGATVYYSGTTLHDTEGDQIAGIGTTSEPSQLGSAQFGLALDNDANTTNMTFNGSNVPNGDNDHFGVNADNGQDTDATAASYDYGADNGSTENGALDTTSASGGDWLVHGVQLNNGHNPQLYPLVAQAPYNLGGLQTGSVSKTNNSVFNPALNSTAINGYPNGWGNNVTDYPSTPPEFAFDNDANTVPAVLATESNQVVDCVTGKMRYIANIAATTPAGIYTTKINYIAAPQY